jgi:para-nitrobenzyl esterase
MVKDTDVKLLKSVIAFTIAFLCLYLLAGCSLLSVQPAPSRFTPSAWENKALVLTSYGYVRGKREEPGAWVWKGIPYARPPVGDLRWKAPREMQPWYGDRYAYEFCAPCTQIDLAFNRVTGKEDCLYLNIWRPRTGETGLPVYVWVHGGRNRLLSASMLPSSHGGSLAVQSNMVFVSVNHRLGPFGWLSHPALQEGVSREDDSGNYGTLDLIHALRWIKENICAFGGDPDNVMITGGTGGGRNILSLIISPLAEGLFSKAMCQSGLPVLHTPGESAGVVEALLSQLLIRDKLAKTEKEAQNFLKTMTDKEIRKYLRGKKKQTIMEHIAPDVEKLMKVPVILKDGYVIPGNGYAVLKTGAYPNKVPLILGSNKDDINLFLSFVPGLSPGSDEYKAAGKYGSLLFKAEGVDTIASQLSGVLDQPPVYTYLFSWGSADENGDSPLPGENGEKLGAFHGLEVPFFLGTDSIFNSFLYSTLFTRKNKKGRKALSSAMMQYVAGFARTGKPDPGYPATDNPDMDTLAPDYPDLPGWHPWSPLPGGTTHIVFDVHGDTPDIHMSYTSITEKRVYDMMKNELSPLLFEHVQTLIRNILQ